MTQLPMETSLPASDKVKALLAEAQSAPTYDEAMPLVTEAITSQLLEAMKAAKLPKAEQAFDALVRSGLDKLLVEALLKGKLTFQAADRHLNRLREAIRTRTLAAQDAKNGILAFDGASQRLALVSGKGGAFQYPLHGNHPRDSLITFASSLHR